MALDFILHDADGGEVSTASIDVDAHYRLMDLVYDSRASNLFRISEFYQEYGGLQEFAVGELPALVLETRKLAAASGEDQEVRSFLTSLAELAEEAVRLARPITVVGD